MNPYDIKIERMKKLKEVWNKFDSQFLLQSFDEKIVIRISNLEELTKIRQFIKFNIYPDWKDRLFLIWNSTGKQILVSYEDSDYPEIEIWFDTNIDNFPKELLPKDKKCQFKKVNEESYKLVCENEN